MSSESSFKLIPSNHIQASASSGSFVLLNKGGCVPKKSGYVVDWGWWSLHPPRCCCPWMSWRNNSVWAARYSAKLGGGGGGCCDPLPLAFPKPSGVACVAPTIWNMQILSLAKWYILPEYMRVSAQKGRIGIRIKTTRT